MKGIMDAWLLTIVVETAFFALWREYRRPAVLGLCLAVNTVSNLTLNLLLIYVNIICRPFSGAVRNWPNNWQMVLDYWGAKALITYFCVVLIFECVVVWAEYRAYAQGLGKSRRLFWRTLAANVLSFASGEIVYFYWSFL